jgi:hypothetical protein
VGPVELTADEAGPDDTRRVRLFLPLLQIAFVFGCVLGNAA